MSATLVVVSFAKLLAAKAKMRPEEGFNLVGVDTFESEPGEELYLVGHFSTREEAEAVRDARLREAPDEVLHIYEAERLAR